MNFRDPLGLCKTADDRATVRNAPSIIEYISGDITIIPQNGKELAPKVGDSVPYAATINVSTESFVEVSNDYFSRIVISKEGNYSVAELTAQYDNQKAAEKKYRHQKWRGAVNTVVGAGQIGIGILIAASSAVMGDDTLPAAGGWWIIWGIQSVGFGLNDFVNAVNKKEVKMPAGPFPALYIDW